MSESPYTHLGNPGSKGITLFNSAAEISNFLKNYEREKEQTLFNIERVFDLELEALQTKRFHFLFSNFNLGKTILYSFSSFLLYQ